MVAALAWFGFWAGLGYLISGSTGMITGLTGACFLILLGIADKL